MFFTLVPIFTTSEDPFTFKSLITVTASPSCNSLPTASRTIRDASLADGSALAALCHSCAHSGQTNVAPSSYVSVDPHRVQGGRSDIVARSSLMGFWTLIQATYGSA